MPGYVGDVAVTTERDLTRLELLDVIEQLEDEYQEVAKALGCTVFFHNYVLDRAKELASFARVA
jgi:hypothetical protein